MTVINLHKRVSDELVDAFAAGSASGFRVAEMKRMASRLLGQGRYPLVLSVTFLLASMQAGRLDLRPGGIEKLVFSLTPQPGKLSDALIAGSATTERLKVEGNTLTLKLSKGESFEIDLTRARLRTLLLGVVALAEFGGFDRFRQAKEDLAAAEGSMESIRAIASAWSDDLDRKLRVEAGGRHMHAKVQAIRDFLARRMGHERYTAGDIPAEAVLEFWTEYSVKGDWKRYATAHEDVVAYLEKLLVESSREDTGSLKDHAEIGVDYLSDDPHTHDPYLHAIDGVAGSWGPFKNAKEGPSYLTESDHERIAPIGDLPAGLEALLKSSLRVMKFSGVENKLARKPLASVLEEALADAPSYAQLFTGANKALNRLELSCWASVHALSAGGRPAALYLLQDLAELDQFHRAFKSIAAEAKGSAQAPEMLLAHFCTSPDPDCRALRARASKAFDDTNREGFRKPDLAKSGGLDRLEDGWSLAMGALKHLRRRLQKLPTFVGEGVEMDDRTMFASTYALIYGINLSEESC